MSKAKNPSVYDREAMAIRKNLRADGVLLVVLGGERGDGISSAIQAKHFVAWHGYMPKLLRKLADDIEAHQTKGEMRRDEEDN